MSDDDSTRTHGLRHHTEAICFPAASTHPTRISVPPMAWDWYNMLPEILGGECETFYQHPGPVFHGSLVPFTMGTSGTQVPNDPQTCTYFGADQVNLDPQTGGLYGYQTLINSHHSSEAVSYATVFPPRTGEAHPSPFGHMVPAIHERDGSGQLSAYHPPRTQSIPDVYHRTTPSIGAHDCLSNWQTAAPPSGPTTHMPDSQTFSSTPALSPQPTFPALGHAPPTVASSPVLKEKGPKKKKRLLATATCPFPHCPRESPFGRPQELEQHILGHLPHWICCTQPGCSWNGYRLDLLRRHLRNEHRDAPFLEHGSEGVKIYDAKRLVKQLLKKDITVEEAEREAHAAFRKRGVWLGIWHA